MHHLFKAVSLTYQNSPVDIREQVALQPGEVHQLLRQSKELTTAQDVLILSTCNRTEIYYSHEEVIGEYLIKLLGMVKGINLTQYENYFVHHTDGVGAVHHLFRVAMGLESQVVGDLQISNQVKQAYQAAADENTASPFLHRLMHTIFFTNKRVSQETAFRDGAASVSYVATELVYDLAAEFVNPKILIIGLGEIGADVCKNIGAGSQKETLHDITLINRTASKAEALAESLGFKTCPIEQLAEAVAEADVVISSAAASEPLITRAHVDKATVHGHKYLIDVSVPRSIGPAVEEVAGVLVYNIDDIQNKANETLSKRLAAVPRVEKIIDEACAGFGQWAQEMEVSPTIQRLKNTLERIRQEEIARHLKNMDEAEVAQLEKITKGMMQKIIKLPVLHLKAACQRGEAETLIDVLNDLFDLEKQPVK